MRIPFIDLQSQQDRIRPQLDAAFARVLDHGRYILGPEVTEFENALGTFENGAKVLGCANGTDAIILPLLAMGVGAGDAVFCPSFTYAATAEAIAITGATPVFVDVDRATYTLDANSLDQAIDHVKTAKTLTPKAVIAVDLFGQPADYPAIKSVTDTHRVNLISDCAQGMGCRLDGQSPLNWADVMTTSFFPAKPLGCYGDGGAILTHDEEMMTLLRSLHFHGRGTEPFDHARIGMNSRLDSMQAAVLIEKLKIFADEIHARNRIADRYKDGFSGNQVKAPTVIAGGLSTWAQYTVEVSNRDAVMGAVKADDIPVAAYYPRPTHAQTAYLDYPIAPNGLPNTEDAKHYVMALPMHAYLGEADQDMVIETVLKHAGT